MANFDRHMTTRIGVGFDITIVEEDARLATLSNYMSPKAMVFQSLSVTFF